MQRLLKGEAVDGHRALCVKAIPPCGRQQSSSGTHDRELAKLWSSAMMCDVIEEQSNRRCSGA